MKQWILSSKDVSSYHFSGASRSQSIGLAVDDYDSDDDWVVELRSSGGDIADQYFRNIRDCVINLRSRRC